MSTDWQVGDLALCVDDSGDWWSDIPEIDTPDGPAVNEVHTVDYADIDASGRMMLGFPEWPIEAFPAIYFRKIHPDEHEACEPEFVTLLKRTKRTVKA